MQLDIITEHEVETLKATIRDAENIIVVGHKSPDGDALGACLAWTEYLRQWGKSAQIIVPDAFPDFLKWLPGSEQVMRYDKHPEEVKTFCQQADVVFCLDFNEMTRLEELQEIVEVSPAKRVLIDHHLKPAIEGVVTVSHPEASSTCELVFRVICQLGGFEHLNQKIAAPIYCGMMTDTGGFTYNSTRPEIYTIIGMLLTTGIDKDKIYRNVFNNYSQWAIRFRGYLMSECLTVSDEYHAAYFTVSRHDMKRFHFVKGDLEGLVNEPLRIKGLKFSVSLREDDRHDNLVLVSLRSVDDFPCNEVAAEFFNGGGHLNASGGKLHCSLKEAEAVTQRAILKFSNRLKA